MTLQTHLWLLIGAWFAYFVVHSLLASLTVKRWVADRWPNLAQRYRLLFNILATVLIIPVAWLTLIGGGDEIWSWQGPWRWVSWSMLAVGIVGFWWTAKYYDMESFMGLRETHPTEEQGFHISLIHRFVRHPWYFLGLLIIWSRDMDEVMLVTAILLTLYLDIGSWLEERKLVTLLGEPYRQYRKRVPKLIPLPWKFLRREEADELVAQARRNEQ